MHRKSHIFIANYVLQNHLSQATPAQKQAFILGCVYPDKNPFTYLKGSVRHQYFRGHNWDNARSYLKKLCQKVEKRTVLTCRSAYELGLLLHYSCDGFTYAHNRWFQRGLREHRSYEHHLHQHLITYRPQEAIVTSGAIWSHILHAHRLYRCSPSGAATDCRYIWSIVVSICSHDPANPAGRG